MDNIKNFNELPEGDAKDSINIFLDDLLKKLSDSFSNQPIEILAHDEYYEVRFVTKEQKMGSVARVRGCSRRRSPEQHHQIAHY